ncbi:HEL287Cp [Eremothecium sinecaudum]|uniref:Riboflavin kinase n=1 Tax=Eremothecium sinecaudum TaxID=45286 RepID=A0A0X8HT70_9SACH|nr:HEL287Cp [Eremothecium sinecaudum]AMD20994.1 HEL287Cp [Eremothecium sinecaudum]
MTKRSADAIIPDTPHSPFPIVADYVKIIPGFGRGSSELGIPTANVPIEQLTEQIQELQTGIYFGWCKLKVISSDENVVKRNNGSEVILNYGSKLTEDDLSVLPVVLSIGWNPFYKNTVKTVELHIIHDFSDTFYGAEVKFSFLGYIRPELNYTTKEALIEDIKTDIKIASETVKLPAYYETRKLIEDS